MTKNEITEEEAEGFFKKAVEILKGTELKDTIVTHGPCAHCAKGKVIEPMVVKDLTPLHHQTIGGESNMGIVSEGLHCDSCGIMYKFPPKKT